MTDHGYTPTRQEVAKRDVAVAAERHWWIAKLKPMVLGWQQMRPDANFNDRLWDICADDVLALIAERERK